MLLKKRHTDLVLVTMFYTVLTAVITFPMTVRMNTSFPGTITGDTQGTIWLTAWLKNAYLTHTSPALAKTVSYPFGINVGAMQVSPLQKWFLPWLSMATNEVFAYNLIIFLSFPLAGLGMYLLVKHITGNKPAAFVSGLVFAFSPYMVLESSLHVTLANIQWMPFYVLFLLKAYEKRDVTNSALAGLFFSFNALMDLHYGLFMAFFTLVFLAYKVTEALIARKKDELKLDLVTLRAAAVFLVIVLAILGPSLYESAGRFEKGIVPSRPLEEIDAYSMKIWDIAIPPSTTPVVGPLARKADIRVYGQDRPYQPNYLGVVPLLLALVGLVASRKESTARLMAVFAFLSFVFALGVFIKAGGLTVPLPWFWIHRLIPWVRVVSRFTVAILLGVAVLVGFGLKAILEAQKTDRSKVVVTAAIILLVLVNYAGMFNYPVVVFGKDGKTSLSSSAYRRLAGEKGDFAVIEYPLLYEPHQYMFMQRVHKKNLINGLSNVAEKGYTEMVERLKTIDSIDLSDNEYDMLKGIDVKYVLVHETQDFDYKSFLRDKEGRHTRLVTHDKGVWMFRLTE